MTEPGWPQAGPFAKARGTARPTWPGCRLNREAGFVERGPPRPAATAKGRRGAGPGLALITARKLVPLPAVPAAGQALRRGSRTATGVPMNRAGDCRAARVKGEDGRLPAPAKVKLAVFLPTQDKLDKDGYPVRDPGFVQLPGHLRARPAYSRTWWKPRASSAAAAHHVRQFHHPRRRSRLDLEHRYRQFPPRQPKIVDACSTPASTCTSSPAILEFMLSEPAAKTGSPPGSMNLTTATFDGNMARPPRPTYPPGGQQEDRTLDKALGYFENNAPRMR